MLDRIKKLLNSIDEDYTSDKEQRQKAENLLNKLKTPLNPDNVIDVMPSIMGRTYFGISFYIPETPIMMIYLLPPKNIDSGLVVQGGMDSKKRLILMSKTEVSDEYLEYRRTSATQREISGVNKQAVIDLFNKEMSYGVHDSTLIHELTHYLDSYRIPSGVGRVANPEDLVSYANNPAEFNAYYQEAVYAMDKMLARRSPKERKKLILSFLENKNLDLIFKVLQLHHFLYNLNPTFKKKLLKRLYTYFSSKIEEM